MVYKKDQGRMARMAAFWTLAILIFYGCASLRNELVVRFSSLGVPIGGVRIPVLGLDLTPALLIAGLILGASLWLLYRWQNKPKNADLLIDTESELRKVTWPTLEEAINGSIVVIFCVLFLMGFLAGTDYVLGELAKIVLLGGRG
ncbi:MAG: preprotein translocase subunit SecE [bacterium]|nr:preprotein translocase subunit SecE [bacterium]